MIGVVTSAGSKVSNFKVGDYVGVGCMVDSCQECKFCKMDEEQYCASGYTSTYGGVSQYGRCGEAGNPTIGGYSDKMVVHEKFAVKVPQNAPLDRAAPLLCAGITMFASPFFKLVAFVKRCLVLTKVLTLPGMNPSFTTTLERTPKSASSVWVGSGRWE